MEVTGLLYDRTPKKNQLLTDLLKKIQKYITYFLTSKNH